MIINIAGGTGIMGKVHAPIFEKAGHKVLLSGRRTNPGLEEAAQLADLTIVSVPIPATEDVIKKVAPYSGAIMDFTGVKTLPVEWMLKYSNDSCEVAGLHPLYKTPLSLKSKTIIYCPTCRTGNKCLEVINALKENGAFIKSMFPEEHDSHMAITQNKRAIILKELASELISKGIRIEEAYELSPPPTRVMLDLLARQVDKSNGSIYEDMADYNPFTQYKNIPKTCSPEEIRTWFGKELVPAQTRAKKLVEMI